MWGSERSGRVGDTAWRQSGPDMPLGGRGVIEKQRGQAWPLALGLVEGAAIS